MGLDNIRLTDSLRHILFPGSLVISHTGAEKKEPAVCTPPPAETIAFLGGNRKKVLFLVNDPDNKFVGDGEMDMLTRLIAACKLTMDDIALANFASDPRPYAAYHAALQPVVSLVFGLTPAEWELPFTIPHFQVQSFNNQQFMIAPALSGFNGDTALKKQLWACLQKIFING